MPVSDTVPTRPLLLHAHILCFAVWDARPVEKGAPINWVELKTSVEIRSEGDMEAFHRKLMKYWIQSFLLGVPKIIVGFRTRDGTLVDVKDMETHKIPETVNSRPNPKWNADMCVNFAGVFLECEYHVPFGNIHGHLLLLDV